MNATGTRGKIPDPARDLRKELRQAQYDKCADAISKARGADPLNITSRCHDLPGAMVKFRSKKGYREGFGPPFCQIRKRLPGKRDHGLPGMQ